MVARPDELEPILKVPREKDLAVVGHDALDPDTSCVKPAHGRSEKCGCLEPIFSLADFEKRKSAGVVDAHVDVLETQAGIGIMAHAINAMPLRLELRELLDVDMDELTGPFEFVALKDRRRFEQRQPMQTNAP